MVQEIFQIQIQSMKLILSPAALIAVIPDPCTNSSKALCLPLIVQQQYTAVHVIRTSDLLTFDVGESKPSRSALSQPLPRRRELQLMKSAICVPRRQEAT